MIEEGDVVWLRSACKSTEAEYKSAHLFVAPKMTVAKIKYGVAYCIWWDGNSYKQDSFRLNTLHVAYKKDEFSE